MRKEKKRREKEEIDTERKQDERKGRELEKEVEEKEGRKGKEEMKMGMAKEKGRINKGKKDKTNKMKEKTEPFATLLEERKWKKR